MCGVTQFYSRDLKRNWPTREHVDIFQKLKAGIPMAAPHTRLFKISKQNEIHTNCKNCRSPPSSISFKTWTLQNIPRLENYASSYSFVNIQFQHRGTEKHTVGGKLHREHGPKNATISVCSSFDGSNMKFASRVNPHCVSPNFLKDNVVKTLKFFFFFFFYPKTDFCIFCKRIL